MNKFRFPDLATIFRALQYRNYRLFFMGQSISLIGTWMQQVAMSWLVYRMTHSAFLLGLVGFIGQIPTFLFAPFAGVIADRHNRHYMLLVTQSLAMLQALILSILVLSHTIMVWQIVILSFCLGLINAFDIPVRQAFTVQMVEKPEDLANAIALNSTMVNMAKLVGPSVAGVMIALVGEGMCFLTNTLSYIAVIGSLLVMRVTHKPVHSTRPIFGELKEGMAYAFNFLPIRLILLLLGLVSLLGGAAQALMPVFATDVFHGGSRTLGFLLSSSGCGALLGAIYLASRRTVIGLGRVIAMTSALFGCGVIVFASSKILWLSVIFLFASGFGMMVEMAASNTILQTVVDEDKRGRVMSLYTMAFMGTAPIGSLLSGVLANKIGATMTLVAGGLVCLAGSLVFTQQLPMFRKTIRPIYSRKGIIPAVVPEVQ
jgi:MFS family permease